MPSDDDPRSSERPANDRTNTTSKTSRRTALGAVGAGLAASFSGCLGFLGGKSGTPTPQEPKTPTPGTPTDYKGRQATGTASPYPKLDFPQLGDGDEPVVIVAEWASPDYKRFMLNEVSAFKPYFEELALVHLDGPQPINGWSQYLPCAAMEVQAQQGMDAFWTFHDRVLQSLGNYSEDAVRDAAQAAGADPDAVVAAGEERRRPLELEEDGTSISGLEPPQEYGFIIKAGAFEDETFFTGSPTAEEVLKVTDAASE